MNDIEFFIEQMDYEFDLIQFNIDLLQFTMQPYIPPRRAPGPRKHWRRY